MSPIFRAQAFALGIALFGVAACEQKKPGPDNARSEADTGTDKYAAADPKLEKALKAAAAASSGSDTGPPPEGLFAPGAADQRHAKGVPTKLDVVSAGGDPKISLVRAEAGPDGALTASYGPAVLEVAMQMGPRSAMPTIDLSLVLGPAKKDEGGPGWLVGTVRAASPAKEQYGQLPPGIEKDIASLEGTQLRVELMADGRETDLRTQPGKSSQPELVRIAQSATGALAIVTVPLPPSPIGEGAQWIAETRMPWSGLDVIAYRAYRVKSIEGERVHLTMDMKAYAANSTTELAGVPKGATLTQFNAEAHGEIELVRGEIVARQAAMQERLMLLFSQGSSPPEPGQAGEPQRGMLTAQIQTEAKFVRGEDLRAAARR
ncbi:MAG: hypothetical protein ABSC94_07530 [Polyangiaceae bacterium]|jgi:hypothetical protein